VVERGNRRFAERRSDQDHCAGSGHVPKVSATVCGMVRLASVEIEMQNAGNTSGIRSLTDTELDDVNGGVAPLVAAFFVGAMTGVTIGALIHGALETGILKPMPV
jgi:lactobin A/cerein 7B family class IIb bacteriocin